MNTTLQRLRLGVPLTVIGLCLWLFGVLSPAIAQPVSELTPTELRGIWYPKGEHGARQCARAQRFGAAELQPGALQINHAQLIEWKKAGQHTMVFVTESRPRKRLVWRLQGLVDVYPYDAPKVLETYVFEVNKQELRWSKRSFDVVAERVDTFVYERCL